MKVVGESDHQGVPCKKPDKMPSRLFTLHRSSRSEEWFRFDQL